MDHAPGFTDVVEAWRIRSSPTIVEVPGNAEHIDIGVNPTGSRVGLKARPGASSAPGRNGIIGVEKIDCLKTGKVGQSIIDAGVPRGAQAPIWLDDIVDHIGTDRLNGFDLEGRLLEGAAIVDNDDAE